MTGHKGQTETYEIWICTGCGQQIAETYEYVHEDHAGEEKRIEVIALSKVRERLLSDDSLDAAASYGWGERNWADFTDGRKAEERIHFREMFEAALAASFKEEGSE